MQVKKAGLNHPRFYFGLEVPLPFLRYALPCFVGLRCCRESLALMRVRAVFGFNLSAVVCCLTMRNCLKLHRALLMHQQDYSILLKCPAHQRVVSLLRHGFRNTQQEHSLERLGVAQSLKMRCFTDNRPSNAEVCALQATIHKAFNS